MSIVINFPFTKAIGFVDSVLPLRGWILGERKIKNIFYVHDEKIIECEYGIERPNVLEAVKAHADIFKTANCGFTLNLGDGSAPSFWYFIVEYDDGRIEKSRQFTNEDFDRFFLDGLAPLSNVCAHGKWPQFLSNKFNMPGVDILEIGARHVANTGLKKYFDKANYTGFDIAPGMDVDIVGDAHMLSSYTDKKFDLVFSSAVFEHLAMPWLAAAEIIKLLKPGGHVFVETHYSYCSHERPWHFFQFSEKALEALFPAAFGIERVESGVSSPMKARFSSIASPFLRNKPIFGNLYCHSEFLGRKVREIQNFNWDMKLVESIYGQTTYPQRPERS